MRALFSLLDKLHNRKVGVIVGDSTLGISKYRLSISRGGENFIFPYNADTGGVALTVGYQNFVPKEGGWLPC